MRFFHSFHFSLYVASCKHAKISFVEKFLKFLSTLVDDQELFGIRPFKRIFFNQFQNYIDVIFILCNEKYQNK